MEFAHRVRRAGGEGVAAVVEITRTYYRIRYGGATLATAELFSIREQIARLK
jgi:hypothetical protein